MFDNGKIVKTVDHSKLVMKLRIEFENSCTEGKPFIPDPVMEEYFSSEMKDKAWWIR